MSLAKAPLCFSGRELIAWAVGVAPGLRHVPGARGLLGRCGRAQGGGVVPLAGLDAGDDLGLADGGDNGFWDGKDESRHFTACCCRDPVG